MTDLRLVRLEIDDLDRMRAALGDAGLPLEGLETATDFYGLHQADTTLGWAALEVYETCALLRSVVIPETGRRTGIGSRLVREVLKAASGTGVERVWLLTETAVPFFEKLGFNQVDRARAPRSIQATNEFQSICPASATCMARKL